MLLSRIREIYIVSNKRSMHANLQAWVAQSMVSAKPVLNTMETDTFWYFLINS